MNVNSQMSLVHKMAINSLDKSVKARIAVLHANRDILLLEQL